jgi:hypothetical protein
MRRHGEGDKTEENRERNNDIKESPGETVGTSRKRCDDEQVGHQEVLFYRVFPVLGIGLTKVREQPLAFACMRQSRITRRDPNPD